MANNVKWQYSQIGNVVTYSQMAIYMFSDSCSGVEKAIRQRIGQQTTAFGRVDDTVGNPHRAQISQFEFFELKFLNSNVSSLSSH